MGLTHLNEEGRAHMVSVTNKRDTFRKAIAKATVSMQPETLERILQGGIEKGDVLAVAQVAGIMGAKKTTDFLEKATWFLATALIVLSLASNFAIPRNTTIESTEIKAQDMIDDAVIPNLPAAPAGE